MFLDPRPQQGRLKKWPMSALDYSTPVHLTKEELEELMPNATWPERYLTSRPSPLLVRVHPLQGVISRVSVCLIMCTGGTVPTSGRIGSQPKPAAVGSAFWP
jgi:hypothetical protein